MKTAAILDLRPTQFAVGMREVELKTRKLKDLGHSELKDFLRDHPVPVVVAPDRELHLIDHHHLARAAWESGLNELAIRVEADLSALSPSAFWKKMEERNWLYLRDQFGKGPHAPELLPIDVRGLADDPFRSLAWALREKKGFEKSPVPFCEFRWSEFLRKHIPGNPLRMGFHQALEAALKLCHHPDAKALPGYVEKD